MHGRVVRPLRYVQSVDDTVSSPPHVLREYAFIGDGERGGLIGPRGDLAWLCFPGWDSGAVFAGLIGGAGNYAVTPTERHVWGGYYEPGTLIWRSRWITTEATVECREALALPSRGDRAVILRRIEVKQGRSRVGVALSPRHDYGRARPDELRRAGDGAWQMRMGDIHAVWTGAGAAACDDDVLRLELDLREGDVHDLVLVLGQGAPPQPVDPVVTWGETEREWHNRVPPLADTAAPRDARHAVAVLHGLTTGGGGMVAAATMSLPERAREGRAFDYRYVWIRDQSYVGQAAARAGVWPLLDAAVSFVQARLLADGPRMMPAYTPSGGRVPDQHELDLPGYPGGADIVGNQVNEQFQLDAFGEALLLLATADRRGRLDGTGWAAAQAAADAIAQRWREEDAGVWELDPQRWTHSALLCAAGLRAMAGRAGEDRGRDWRALAEALLGEARRFGLHPSGRWQRARGDERVDAALLLAAVRGAVPPGARESTATLAAVQRDLVQDGYCYRYRPDERPLGEAEGAFLLCGFILCLALAQQGRDAEALRWFERARASCGPPGLLSEEFDVVQRQLRGNLPQAFVHGMLLECAATLGDPAALAAAGRDGPTAAPAAAPR